MTKKILALPGGRAFVHADAGGGLIDQVDGFVGQEALGHIAGGEVDRRVDGGIRDDEVMVLLVGSTDALEDLDGLIHGRLIHLDRLEAPFEGGIGFNMLSVFVHRGRADDLQFAAGKGGLEDVGGIDGGTGGAGAHQHVDFIYKEDGTGLLELINDALEPLLELTAIHGAGNQRTDIQLQQTLVHERSGDVAIHDALGETFDDGGLADAGLTDQRGVVLGAACQDLDDALDLLLATDDGVELFLLRLGGQVGGKLVHEGSLLRLLTGALLGLCRSGRCGAGGGG